MGQWAHTCTYEVWVDIVHCCCTNSALLCQNKRTHMKLTLIHGSKKQTAHPCRAHFFSFWSILILKKIISVWTCFVWLCLILCLLHLMYFFIVCLYNLACLVICISLYSFMPFCNFCINVGFLWLFYTLYVLSCFHCGFFVLVHTSVYCLCTDLLWTPFFCVQFFT